VSKPDIVNELPDGGREEIHIKKHFRADGSRSIIRKIRDANGVVLEVWHTVVARDGSTLHGPHLEYQAPKDAP
jgi:hypothetical protein